MILLKLFLVFLKIGAVSFGGGYGMISLVREEVIKNLWLTEEEFMDIIAVSESTPGPIAVNMATFVGSQQAGIAGAFFATLGVILPAFIIILLIAAILKNLLRYKGVNAFLDGVRPAVIALIVSTGALLVFRSLFGISNIKGGVSFDFKAILIFSLLALLSICAKLFKKKQPSPIILIAFSAFLGILVYSF